MLSGSGLSRANCRIEETIERKLYRELVQGRSHQFGENIKGKRFLSQSWRNWIYRFKLPAQSEESEQQEKEVDEVEVKGQRSENGGFPPFRATSSEGLDLTGVIGG